MPPSVRHAVDGVLLLNKPRGLTSQQAVSRAKHLFQARKAGHTGTLDPMADGLLPLGFGEATKFSQFLLDADKDYRATLRLGTVTATGDAEGEILEIRPVAATSEQVAAVLQRFTGQLTQIPPMHSAIKVRGKPLYAYARAGETVLRESRRIVINSIELIDFKNEILEFRVSCSKGTYIRVLAEDIGNALGCGAHLTALTRERSGHFDLSDAVSLGQLEAMAMPQRLAQLLPLDIFAADLPMREIAPEDQQRLCNGQRLLLGAVKTTGLCRLYGSGGMFFGIGEIHAGTLLARRLVSQPQAVPRSQNDLSKPAVTG